MFAVIGGRAGAIHGAEVRGWTNTRDRVALLELFMIGVLLAIGGGILSSLLSAAPRRTQLIVAILIVFAVFAWSAVSRFRDAQQETTIESFLVYDSDRHELIDVPNYRISEALSRYLDALFAERPHLFAAWLNHPPDKAIVFDERTRTLRRRDTEGSLLLQDALEYYLLDRLATHVSAYFQDSPIEGRHLTRFGNENLPADLASNRFLSTFATPPHLRSWRRSSERLPHDEVWSASGPGFEYSRFELVLPRESSIHRVPGGMLRVENKEIVLEIGARFTGMGAILPDYFLERYVGISGTAVE